ncbi:hypothetical protein [Lacticaseibacillus camelliae]|nr:hypothetical protein [Lacticaseibacillus camelliae]
MSKLEFKQVTRNFGANKVLRGVNMTWEPASCTACSAATAPAKAR